MTTVPRIKKSNKGLVLDNVSISVSGKQIVHDVTLSIKPGELHILMGPNGSGKSTLLYALMGHPQYVITKGTALVSGTVITKLPPEKRAHKGLFLGFQQPREIQGLRTAAFLRSLSLLYSGNKSSKKQQNPLEFMKQAREYMSVVQLDHDFLGRSLNEGFSGGEKKKMELVQMMVVKPTIALLDEIDSGVDMDALKSICSTIKMLQKKYKIGILLVTHNPRVLSHISPDRIHIMKDGTIYESGGKKLAQRIEKEGFKKVVNSKT